MFEQTSLYNKLTNRRNVNCTVHLFGNLGLGYTQYPLGEDNFAANYNFVDSPTQMIIQRENNLIHYKYIYRGGAYYIGLCLVANEVVAHDIHNMYQTLEILFDEHILRNPAIFENNVPKMQLFQDSSEELKEVVLFFERLLSNSDFGYHTIGTIGSDTILQDTLALSLDVVNDNDIIVNLSKYQYVIVYKDKGYQSISTLSAINRIRKESEEWDKKTKDYDSSTEHYFTILLMFVVSVIMCSIPYFMFLKPKDRLEEEICKKDAQTEQIHNQRNLLSKTLSSLNDSVNMLQKENDVIARHFKLLEETKEREKASRTFVIGNVEFAMKKVNGGRFLMGSNSGEDDESPTHYVTLRGYYIGETEVTQELWKAVMHSNPSSSTGNERPVTNVSWNDCMIFVRNLNEMTGLSFALPTEAQWEFAARGGNKSRGYKYSGSDSYSAVANCVEYSFWGELLGYSNTVDYVASYSSNELGIYDMSGNVWEWCYDTYGDYSYSEQKNPSNGGGNQMVIRGGGYKNTPSYCRSTYRGSKNYSESADNIGFRLVLNE